MRDVIYLRLEATATGLFVEFGDKCVGEFEAGFLQGGFAGYFFGEVDGAYGDAVGADEFVFFDVGDFDFGSGAAGDEVASAGGELAEGFAGDGDVGIGGILDEGESAGFEDFLDFGFAGWVGDGYAEVLFGDVNVYFG